MSSVYASNIVSFADPHNYEPNLVDFGEPVLRDAFFADVGSQAPLTINLPQIPPPRLAFHGYNQEAVNSFLYGRIYVDPALLNLGNLVSSQTREFSVWNATFGSSDVTSVLAANDEGLTLAEPLSAPYTLQPLQQVFYSVAISVDGPAQIAATYSLIINDVVYTVQVTGSRVVIWPFPPNWSSAVNEALEFYTNVLKSFDGMEQRVSLRTKARRRLSYDFRVLRTDSQHLDNILWGWQNRSFAVPYWQYKAKTTAPIIAGALFVPCDTSTSGFVAGQTMALFKSILVYEVLEVAAVAPNGLTLANETNLAWPTGSAVYPVAISTFESNVPVKRQTSSALDGTASFIAAPVETDPFVPAVVATDLYNGVEVILQSPDWVNTIDNAATFDFDVIDFQTGQRSYALSDSLQSLAYGYRWLLKTRAEVNAFRAFLGRLKGQLNAIYIPSWHEDFTLSQGISSGDAVINVVDRSFFQLVGINPARGNIMIRTRSHGHFFRPIVAIAKAGPNATINIGTALGVSVPIADVIQICYVSLYRKSTDTTTIQWQTDQVAIIEETFQLVPA